MNSNGRVISFGLEKAGQGLAPADLPPTKAPAVACWRCKLCGGAHSPVIVPHRYRNIWSLLRSFGSLSVHLVSFSDGGILGSYCPQEEKKYVYESDNDEGHHQPWYNAIIAR